jgi:hypothetical protein
MIAANGKEILSIFHQIKAVGQEGTAKMSGRNQLESVCAMDRIGLVSKDAGDRLRGAVRPSCMINTITANIIIEVIINRIINIIILPRHTLNSASPMPRTSHILTRLLHR